MFGRKKYVPPLINVIRVRSIEEDEWKTYEFPEWKIDFLPTRGGTVMPLVYNANGVNITGDFRIVHKSRVK